MRYRDLYPKIEGVRIDLVALMSLRHTCDPSLCRHGPRCCATYEVCIEPAESGKIVGGLGAAARWAKAVRTDAGRADVLEETDDGLLAMGTDDSGLCLLAFRDRKGRTLCALHAAALDSGTQPAAMKPRSCCLWPLALSEGRSPVLTVVDDALAFPCNHRRRAHSGLDDGVQQVLREVFGPEFADCVFQLAAQHKGQR